MGHDFNFSLMSYNDEYKLHRRVFMGILGPGALQKFNRVQEYASRKLLERILNEPEDFVDHLRLYVPLISYYIRE